MARTDSGDDSCAEHPVHVLGGRLECCAEDTPETSDENTPGATVSISDPSSDETSHQRSQVVN